MYAKISSLTSRGSALQDVRLNFPAGDRYYQLLEGAKICTNLADLPYPTSNCRAVDEAFAKTISDAKNFGKWPSFARIVAIPQCHWGENPMNSYVMFLLSPNLSAN